MFLLERTEGRQKNWEKDGESKSSHRLILISFFKNSPSNETELESPYEDVTKYTQDKGKDEEPNNDKVYDELVPYVITTVTLDKENEREYVVTQDTAQDEIPVYLQVV